MKGWYGQREQHKLASKGIRSSLCKNKAKGIDEMLDSMVKQVMESKFPLVFEFTDDEVLEYITDHMHLIREYCEGDESCERRIIKKMKTVKISKTEFLEYTGWKDDFNDYRNEIKEEYKDERRDAKEDGRLDEFWDYNDWLWDMYGVEKVTMDMFIKEHLGEDEIRMTLNDMKYDIQYDLWTWVED